MKTSALLSAAILAALLHAPLPTQARDSLPAPTKTFDLTKVLPCPPQSNIAPGGLTCAQDPAAQKADYQGVLDARNSANDDEIAAAMEDAAFPTLAQFMRPIWMRLANPAPEACTPAKTVLQALDHDRSIAAQRRLKEGESELETALPATVAALKPALYAEYRASDSAKDVYNRTRPYVIRIEGLPAIQPLAEKQYLNRLAKSSPSYPSGHTTFAFTSAAMLAALLPDQAQIIMNRAERYGWHRIVVGVHFPTDVAAGKQAGLLVADAYLNDPTSKPGLEAARAELRKALCY